MAIWMTREKAYEPSEVARKIAEAFRTGPIKHHDIQHSGISEIEVTCWGKAISASWYSGSDDRDLVIDGSRCAVSEGDARFILAAARERGRRLTQEAIDALAAHAANYEAGVRHE